MHKTKVNTNGGEMSSVDVKKFAFVIDGEYGKLVFETRGALYDHMSMRNQQIHTLFLMVYGSGSKEFTLLGEENRDNVLWTLHQFTSEAAQAARLLLEGMV